MRPPLRRSHALLWVAASISGAATLVWELAWLRDLTLAVGGTYPALSVVLAGFMLGLGVGSALGGLVADRVACPARAYALVEVGVALAALVFVAAVGPLGQLAWLGSLWGRAGLAALAMLPATIGMGATFPLLSRALHPGGDSASHVPALYAVNTLGATLGCVLGGAVLPYVIGLHGTYSAALGANLLAALLAGVAAWRVPAAPAPALDRLQPASHRSTLRLAAPVALFLAAGSGLLVTASEVFWTRSISQLDLSAFEGSAASPQDMVTLVVGLLLLGQVLGALIAHRLVDGPDMVLRALSITWSLGAVLALLGLEWFTVAGLGLHRLEFHRWPGWIPWVRLLPVVPSSVLLGMAFPLLARLYSGDLAGHGRRMGLIWALNTGGAVLGSLLSGMLLLPWVGAGLGLVGCAIAGVLLSGACLLAVKPRLPERVALASSTLGLVVVIALVPLGPGQWFRLRHGPESVLATWEGWESTTVVADTPAGRVISSNGRRILHGQQYERRGARLVELLRPAPRVLLVGFGTGTFARLLAEEPGLEHLTVVELDPAQFQAAPWFGNAGVFTHDKVDTIADDALHYLAVSTDTFDAIVIDAWGPESSPAVFTVEMHRRVLAHLAPGGAVYAKLSQVGQDDLAAVLDAARCTHGRAWIRDDPPTAVLAAPGPIATLDRGPEWVALPEQAPCEPLRHAWPRRMKRLKAPAPGDSRRPGR